MNRPEHDNVNFFFGQEVEHTPAHGMDTLFVVGVQPIEQIKEKLAGTTYQTKHIYFGANQSFPSLKVNDGSEWAKWERMIYYFLDNDYLCTLDIDLFSAEGLLESGLTERHNFIPMISVKLPYVQQYGYNATIKIDDKDFKATNPGVWCHSLHTLMDRSKFTDWDQYKNDLTFK